MHNIQILKVANKFPIWLPCKKSSTPITRRVAYITEWPVASERIRKWGGGTGPERSAGKKLFGRAPPLFGSKSTISRFGERFRDGSVWSVSCLLFFYSQCPRAPWSRRHWEWPECMPLSQITITSD